MNPTRRLSLRILALAAGLVLAASGLAAPVRAQAPFDSVLDRPALADSSARDS
ncbi:MAG: hypothetical protein HOP12_14630, partial [Candidatus Eisenbacteria bacterium]|nr:hypothetical protein [Candidatus Eisenbacteria bacterium]